MASDKLKAYLAYYQKTLREDPKNIEARLRLAALFRQMNRVGHAIEEYVTASKLLAAQGLPLEAIAACKAVLELDPTHTEVQFFLAKLFAQAPGASGQSMRIAQPVGMVERPPKEVRLPDVSGFLPLQQDPDSQQRKETAHAVLPLPALAPSHERDPGDQAPTQVFEAIPSAPHFTAAELGSLDDDFATEPLTQAQQVVAQEHERAFSSPHHEPTKVAHDFLLAQSLSPFDFPGLEPLFEDSEPLKSLRQTQDIDRADVLEELLYVTPKAETTVREASFELGVFDLEMFDAEEIDSEALEELEGPWNGSADITLEQDESLVQTGEMPRQRVDIALHEMPDVPLFNRLSQEAFVQLLGQVHVQHLPAEQAVLEPGHGLRSLFIVVQGALEVTKVLGPSHDQTVHLTRFGEGDFFGEFSLLTGLDGGATVKTLTAVMLLEITEQMIHDVSRFDPSIWDTLWEVYTFRMLNNVMASHPILGHMTVEEREYLIPYFVLKDYLKGQVVMHPGERCGHVSLLLFGSLGVTHPGRPGSLSVIAHGEFFGLIASLSDEPCKACVTAQEDVTLLCLPGQLFRQITRQSHQVAAQIRQLLKSKHITPQHSL